MALFFTAGYFLWAGLVFVARPELEPARFTLGAHQQAGARIQLAAIAAAR